MTFWQINVLNIYTIVTDEALLAGTSLAHKTWHLAVLSFVSVFIILKGSFC